MVDIKKTKKEKKGISHNDNTTSDSSLAAFSRVYLSYPLGGTRDRPEREKRERERVEKEKRRKIYLRQSR